MSDRTSEVDNRLMEAAAARERGAVTEERRLLDAALKIASADPRVLNARGMRALADNDFDGAREYFTAAARADPGAAPLWINLATACRALDDDEGEQESLQKALSIDQLNFIAQLRMAELHERNERKAEAAISWGNVVQMAIGMHNRPPRVSEALAQGQAYLTAHRQGLASGIDAEFGKVFVQPGPVARRFKACMDHVLGRRSIYPNVCAGLHYPFLPADEFFDREHFPWLAELESQTPAISRELSGLLAGGGQGFKPYVRQDVGTPDNIWSGLDQSLDWGAFFLWEYGRKLDDACARCPATAAALEAVPMAKMPGRAPTAFFSLLRPGTRIPPHTGVSNTRTIIHLPLLVPPRCGFRVGGTVREWRVGEAFAFDDTIEHEAWNDSDELRAVLIFDVWNPHLSGEECAMVRRFFTIADLQGRDAEPSWHP
jgi:aspartyl/asparaginyl beta-hydroxylase (cupin superfamily)